MRGKWGRRSGAAGPEDPASCCQPAHGRPSLLTPHSIYYSRNGWERGPVPLGAPCLPQVGADPARFPSPLGIDFRRAVGWGGSQSSQTLGVGVTCPKGKALSADLPSMSPQVQDGGRRALTLFLVTPCASVQLQKANVPCGAPAAPALGPSEPQCSTLHTLH